MNALSEKLRELQAAEPRTNVASCARSGAFTQAAELAEAYEMEAEFTNAELAKLGAELEQNLAWRDTALNQCQAQNAALTKRVAELEAKQCAHEAELAVAHEFIADLQSQLAWTPVSAGLPTEPGWYVFYDSLRRFTGWLSCFELRRKDKWPWMDDEGDEWNQPEFEAHTTSLYTHYRRIDLPKDGES